MVLSSRFFCAALFVAGIGSMALEGITVSADELARIALSSDGDSFIKLDSKRRFTPWGFNYLGQFEQLAEETWESAEGWQQIEKAFAEMKVLGANCVRWHLQFATYMQGPDRPNQEALERLGKLLELATQHELYLDLTGLNCFRLDNIPDWYDRLGESDRWNAQACFWSAIAKTCAGSPAVFCYDLMNEPVLGEPKEDQLPWVTGELGGFHFVQRISHNSDASRRDTVAAQWVGRMVAAIREHDSETLITVGAIPWRFVWASAKPLFYSPPVVEHLDFVSIHVYPQSERLGQDIEALQGYDIGKPLVVEEIFPLRCSVGELDEFIEATKPRVDGWISHYFGHTIEEHREGAKPGPAVAAFLSYWASKSTDLQIGN